MNKLDECDHLAADLIANCYGKLSTLAIVIRQEGENIRILSPDIPMELLATTLYRAADACADQSIRINFHTGHKQ